MPALPTTGETQNPPLAVLWPWWDLVPLYPLDGCAKKQGAVSHSTSESEIIALDANVRMEGVHAITLWDYVVQVIDHVASLRFPKRHEVVPESLMTRWDVYFVLPMLAPLKGLVRLFVFEDNEAVINITELNDPNQPYSCTQWQNAGVSGMPINIFFRFHTFLNYRLS